MKLQRVSAGAQAHLDDYAQTGTFPSSHDPLFGLIMEEAESSDAYLDLCGGTGLLGARIHHNISSRVWTLDGDLHALERGKAAGVPQELMEARLTANMASCLHRHLNNRRTTIIVSRHGLSELFGRGRDYVTAFKRALAGTSVRTIYSEGRKFGDSSVEYEAESLWPEWVIQTRRGQCAKFITLPTERV